MVAKLNVNLSREEKSRKTSGTRITVHSGKLQSKHYMQYSVNENKVNKIRNSRTVSIFVQTFRQLKIKQVLINGSLSVNRSKTKKIIAFIDVFHNMQISC